MNEWNFEAPREIGLGDHDVPLLGSHLQGKRIALLVTGGIAAIKSPLIARMLRRYGADVTAYISKSGLEYTTVGALEWCTTNPVIQNLSSASEHLSDGDPFDAYLVAPATYNTINKMASGIADDALSTTLASALGRMEQGKSQVLVAPTMHNTLHNSLLTASLKKLNTMGVRVIPPRIAYGKNNIPHEKVLAAEVCRAVSTSPLKGKKIMITGGNTPVPIDNVRRICNRFRGRLGAKIAEEIYLRGAESCFILGDGAYRPERHIPFVVARTYDDYLRMVMDELDSKKYDIGIFSAAVADYQPESRTEGKIPSGQDLTIKLKSTTKVIREVRKRFEDLFMVTFKYQENITHEELMKIAQSRIDSGYPVVVANRGEDIDENGQQIAHMLTGNEESKKMVGKSSIARGIADLLEKRVL